VFNDFLLQFEQLVGHIQSRHNGTALNTDDTSRILDFAHLTIKIRGGFTNRLLFAGGTGNEILATKNRNFEFCKNNALKSLRFPAKQRDLTRLQGS